MKRRLTPLAAIVAGLALGVWCRPLPRPGPDAESVADLPRMTPDLDGVTWPPNLAPPALRVDEPGDRFYALARGGRGVAVEAAGRRPEVAFPLRRWRRLLAAEAGASLTLTVAVRGPGRHWRRFRPLTIQVAAEPIDRYLVYRWITPLYNFWSDVGIYQRDLTGFRTTTVMHGRQFHHGCVNCHTLSASHPDRFSLGFRHRQYGNGTLLSAGGRTVRLDRPVGYGSWHPSGRFATYSVNQVRQFFHAAGEETRDVLDITSSLVSYHVAEGRFTPLAGLDEEGWLDTYPCWAPDGRWLYFARARRLWRPDTVVPPPQYRDVRYSLMRVPYDPATDRFGRPEVVRSSEAAGRSLVFPRVSPDGRWLLHTACDYGCFPIHQPSSDLGLIDLRTGRDVPLAINSARADTRHSWSSNGRWIAFSSKRADGLFTKVYLSYLDRDGRAHKPILLPQRDARFYDTLWYSYNVPELSDSPVPSGAGELGRALRSGGLRAAPAEPVTGGSR
ncbi:MAG: PD40 domain-containing protein [Armatimonadetes bacterium]|nr:PD40 domain-containing protein [Armatimonadota bacterium]